jgi:FdhE protein
MADPFEKRLRRAEFLLKEWPFAADLLKFMLGVFRLQRQIHTRLSAGTPEDPQGTSLTPLVAALPELIDWVLQSGPPQLSKAAETVRGYTDQDWEGVLGQYDDGIPAEEAILDFFPSAVLQPYRFRFQRSEPPPAGEPLRHCPDCGFYSIVSLLREDKAAETVRRTLICSLCSREWEFPRVLCPFCTEEKPEKLPRYTAQEIPWMRVDACDTCRRYIKSVDLTLNWDAEPIVDELASTPLDVIAREHGYTKITPNLAGI